MSLLIKAKKRTQFGRQNNELRRRDSVPAIVYGKGFKNQNLELEYNPFSKVFKSSGYSSLIDLEIDNNQPIKVLIQDIQKHPVTDRITHVDFHQVSMTEKIEARVALKFVGESSAVKEFHGVLVKHFTEIMVKSLPQDLVPEIEIDISGLKIINARIIIKDLKFPKGIEPLVKPDEAVVTVKEVAEEKEVVPVTEAEAVAGVGVIEKKKETEEGSAEKGVEPGKKEDKSAAAKK